MEPIKEEQMNVISLSLKQLNLYDTMSFLMKPTKGAGWKLTPQEKLSRFSGIQTANFLQ